MAIIEVSVVPIGTGTASVSAYVARAVDILAGAGDVKYELTPMGTVIEGDLDRILELVLMMHRSAFTGEANRVLTTIKIDERRDKPQTMQGKVESVQGKLRRPQEAA